MPFSSFGAKARPGQPCNVDKFLVPNTGKEAQEHRERVTCPWLLAASCSQVEASVCTAAQQRSGSAMTYAPVGEALRRTSVYIVLEMNPTEYNGMNGTSKSTQTEPGKGQSKLTKHPGRPDGQNFHSTLTIQSQGRFTQQGIPLTLKERYSQIARLGCSLERQCGGACFFGSKTY